MEDELRRQSFAAFERAVEIAGGQSQFERLTGAKQQNVSNWVRKGQLLPGEFVLAAEAATGVSRHDLRPDIYPRGLQDDCPFRLPRNHFLAVDRPEVACERRELLQAGAR